MVKTMLRVAQALAAAAVIGGCATTATVDDDPLTEELGESGVTVQRATEELSPAALRPSLRGADLSEVNRLNWLLSRLVRYQPPKVDPGELDAAVRNPDAAYAVAIKNLTRWRRTARELAASSIPASAYADSPEEVKSFVAHWNDYVAYWREVAESTADLVEERMALKDPTTRFLRRAREAIKARDQAAYRSAVEAYKEELETSERKTLRDPAPLAGGSEADLFERLVDDADGSDVVGDLVQTLHHDYPRSFFAERFSR